MFLWFIKGTCQYWSNEVMCLYWKITGRLKVCVFFFTLDISLWISSNGTELRFDSWLLKPSALCRAYTWLCPLPALCMDYDVYNHLHYSQHASKKSVSNAGFVCLFSLSPSIPEVNNNMPGEFDWKKSMKTKYDNCSNYLYSSKFPDRLGQ